MLSQQKTSSFPLNGSLEHDKEDEEEEHLSHHHLHRHHHHHHSVEEEEEEEDEHQHQHHLHHHHQQTLEDHQQLQGLEDHSELMHSQGQDDEENNHDGMGGANVLPPITEVEALGKPMSRGDLHMYSGMVTPAHPILAPMYTHLPLNPSTPMDEMPLYVNAKQYNRILKRRQARAKLESENIILPRKGYLHPSRHKWAKGRKRGPGGRFLSKEDGQKDDDDDDDVDADIKAKEAVDVGVTEVEEPDKKRPKTM